MICWSEITGKFYSMLNNYYLPLLIKEYLRYYDKHMDVDQLRLVLESDPSFPSLLCIRKTCNYFGINSKAYKGDYDALLDNAMPVIVHWKTENEEKFVLVNKVTPESVDYYDAAKHQKFSTTKDDFCRFWTGVLIISEKSGKQEADKITTSKKIHRVYGLGVMVILIAFLFGFQNSQNTTSLYFPIVLFLLKTTGVWLSANIIRHEAGFIYSSFDNFCNKLESFDCIKVLNSNASKIFNTFSLADIGFAYYSVGIFAIVLGVFSGLQSAVLSILFYTSVGGIPIVLFSVFYQKFIVKKWCPLCLGVMGLILMENLMFQLYPSKVLTNSTLLSALILLSISLICSILIVHYFKTLLTAQSNVFINKLQNLKLKRNPAVQLSLFNLQKRTEMPINNSIFIGNQQAPIVLTTLLSPMCKPCKKMTYEILQLMERYSGKILWQIRFDGIGKKGFDNLHAIQLHLMQLCKNEESDMVKLQIIKDWFSMQSFQWFAAKYPIDEIHQETSSGFLEHINENAELGVDRVPVLWINSKILPQQYSVVDIPFLLTDTNFLLQLTK